MTIEPLQSLGRWLVSIGLVTAIVGGVLVALPRVPFLGRLPGDILVKKENVTFYFPLATSILVSLALTLLFRLLNRK